MRAIVFGVLIALAGCAPVADEPAAQAVPVPAAVSGPEATAASASSPASPADAPAPASDAPAAPPLPATAPAPAPEAAQRVPKDLLKKDGVDYACSVPADCAVKDVGNCCGYYPACVNKDSPTFPDKVKAQCADSGMSSICGYREIAACDCIEGRCTAQPDDGGAEIDVRKD